MIAEQKVNTNYVTCSSICNSEAKLVELHNALSHPGVTRMNHFIQCRNLPHSTEEVNRIVNQCPICAELKPRFYKPPEAHLIKSTQPFERLNIDFKGPVPTSTRNKYILTIVDEYSRFLSKCFQRSV